MQQNVRLVERLVLRKTEVGNSVLTITISRTAVFAGYKNEMAFEREEKRHISVSKVETNIHRRILNQFSQIAQARLFFLHLLSSNPYPLIPPPPLFNSFYVLTYNW